MRKSREILDKYDLDSFYELDERDPFGEKVKAKKIVSHIKEEGIDPFHGSSFYTDYSYLDSNKPKRSISYITVLVVFIVLIILIKIFI